MGRRLHSVVNERSSIFVRFLKHIFTHGKIHNNFAGWIIRLTSDSVSSSRHWNICSALVRRWKSIVWNCFVTHHSTLEGYNNTDNRSQFFFFFFFSKKSFSTKYVHRKIFEIVWWSSASRLVYVKSHVEGIDNRIRSEEQQQVENEDGKNIKTQVAGWIHFLTRFKCCQAVFNHPQRKKSSPSSSLDFLFLWNVSETLLLMGLYRPSHSERILLESSRAVLTIVAVVALLELN